MTRTRDVAKGFHKGVVTIYWERLGEWEGQAKQVWSLVCGGSAKKVFASHKRVKNVSIENHLMSIFST